MLTTIASVGGIKHSPRCICGRVGLQVDGDKLTFNLMGLCVNPFVGFPNGGALFLFNHRTSVAETTCKDHGQGHGTTEEEALHDDASLRRDLKASLLRLLRLFIVKAEFAPQVEQMLHSFIRMAAHPSECFSVDKVDQRPCATNAFHFISDLLAFLTIEFVRFT